MNFVSEQRNRDRRQGNPDRGDAAYGAEWAKLSADEKKRYRDRANGTSNRNELQLSGHVAAPPAGAMSADSAPDGLDEEERSAEEKELQNMTAAYMGDNPDDAAARKVVIAGSNVMVKTTEGKYYPMEVALVKYSLREGVGSQYHQFTDPGPVPLGYFHKAQTHIDNTHRIPLQNFDQAIGRFNREQAFEEMLTEMAIFWKESEFQYKGRTCILIFTRDDMVDQLKGSLSFYMDTSGHREMRQWWDEGRIRVADISFLIHQLYAAVGIPMALPLCADIPNIASFDWMSGSCQFHTEADNNFCALGVCKRWCYLISDSLLETYDIEPVEGKHLPLSIQSAIHVEEAPSDGVWNVSRDNGRRPARPFMAGSVSGDNTRPGSAAAPSQAESLSAEPRLREFEPPAGIRPGVGRGIRRT